MVEKKYSRGMKAFAIIMNFLFMIGLVVGIYLILYCIGRGQKPVDTKAETEYVESGVFEKDAMYEIEDVLNYVRQKANYEFEGEYYDGKYVDLTDYIEHDYISGTYDDTSVGFAICDILEMGAKQVDHINYECHVFGDGVIAIFDEKGNKVGDNAAVILGNMEAYDAEENGNVSAFNIRGASREEAETIKKNTENGVYYEVVEEGTDDGPYEVWTVSTMDTKSICGYDLIDLLKNGIITSLPELYKYNDYLERAVAALPQDIEIYEKLKVRFAAENTNIIFAVQAGDTLVSNDEKMLDYGPDQVWAFEKEMEDRLKEYEDKGAYFFYDKENGACSTSLKGVQEELVSAVIANPCMRDDYAVYIGIDTDFPIRDTFYQARAEYENLRPMFVGSIIGSIICGFGVLVTLAYLTLTAGYESSKREIKLNSFDRIKSEVALVIVIAAVFTIFVGGIDLERRFDYSQLDNILIVMIISAVVGLVDILFLIGYLSLVRRVRAGQLWKNSFAYMIANALKKVVYTGGVGIKAVLKIVFFVGTMGALEFWAVNDHEEIALILLILDFLLLIFVTFKDVISKKDILVGADKIREGDLNYKINTEKMHYDNKALADAINSIADGFNTAVDRSTKDERLKTDLITNVSHDIKTPLTTIISYVDLLKREDIQDEKVKGYIDVLENRANRLKQLTEDLVEASKISSGNIEINLGDMDFAEFVTQVSGEFEERFEEKQLTMVKSLPEEPVLIVADGMRLYRVMENLFNNAVKYSMPNTRVYVKLAVEYDMAVFEIKNVSTEQLDIDAQELSERFIRGDKSRGTEGTGLGLSIAKSLTTLQNGTFDISVDGDLFKVDVAFKLK